MTASTPNGDAVDSRLKQMRHRAHCSAADLAQLAGVAPNTVLNAERGRPTDPQTQRLTPEALTALLQREVYNRIGHARAAVTRAQVELEGSQHRLDQAESQLVDTETQLRNELEDVVAEVESLWVDVPSDD